MRAISLWQPWASLWLSGRKVHETRKFCAMWNTGYRGPLAVHAAQKIIHDVAPAVAGILEDEFGGHWGRDLPRGAIIGTLDLVGVISTVNLVEHNAASDDDYFCGDWSAGRLAWKAANLRLFARPIPYSGKQGWFTVPDELIRSAA